MMDAATNPNPFHWLREWFIWITGLFVNWALFWYGQIWPFSYLGDVFNLMSDWSAGLATVCYDAIMPWNTIISDLANIWYWVNKLAPLGNIVNAIFAAVDWIKNAATEIGKILAPLWASFKLEVQELIDAATAGLAGLLKAWDDFKTYTLPKLLTSLDLVDWWKGKVAEVQKLIDTAMAGVADAINTWQEVREQVFSFLGNPLEWLWGKFADWFLGPE